MDGTLALVTVHVAYAQHDLQLPAEVPMAELIPLLLVALDLAAAPPAPEIAARWGLGRPNALTPLADDTTLLQAGVLDGEELVLQEMAVWRSPPAAPVNLASSNAQATNRWEI